MTRTRRRIVVASLLALAVGGVVWRWSTWPDVAALARQNPETTAFIERHRDRTGKAPAWRWVPYTSISTSLRHAVVVAEDIEFFAHDGFSRAEVSEALRKAWDEKEAPRGASTITQQVAKNLWLSPSRNPWRKVEEALLTRQLEKRLSKRRILEIYLNLAQFGPDAFGAEAAARRYFGAPASALTLHQAAQLAAGLPRPSTWHPGVTTRGYQRRVAVIEARVARTSWLAKEL